MRDGREEEIMGCGSCLQGCLAKVKAGGPVSCLINPELGREGAPALQAAAVGEPLVVVGGGPAGLEAALVAHRAGFQVTLFERRSALGGQFALAGLTTGKEAMERPFRSLVRAVENSGIDIRTGAEPTIRDIAKLHPSKGRSSSPPDRDRSSPSSSASRTPSQPRRFSPGRLRRVNESSSSAAVWSGSNLPSNSPVTIVRSWWSRCSRMSPAIWKRSPAK